MKIQQATPEQLSSPKYDRRKENPGRAPLVDISGWKPGDVLDVSEMEGRGVIRSVRDQARKRGWEYREIAPGVFLRLLAWDVYREERLLRSVVAATAEEAVLAVVGDVKGPYSAVLHK